MPNFVIEFRDENDEICQECYGGSDLDVVFSKWKDHMIDCHEVWRYRTAYLEKPINRSPYTVLVDIPSDLCGTSKLRTGEFNKGKKRMPVPNPWR